MRAVFVALCLLISADKIIEKAPPRDLRAARLETFFRAYRCPQPYHIANYLRAADAYALDYRLLPAISVRESTCGSHAMRNNYWGWGSRRFDSLENGIDYVSWRLSSSPTYRDRPLRQKLQRYNPHAGYAQSVEGLMKQVE